MITTRDLAQIANLLAQTPPGPDHDAIAAQAEGLATRAWAAAEIARTDTHLTK